MSISGTLKGIRFSLRDKFLNRKNRKNLTNINPTLITSDCIGAVVAHDLRLRFNSPTVDFYFSASGFLEFIENPEKYIDAKMCESDETGYPYPVAKLIDISLYLVHYKDIQSAQIAWDRRKKRMNLNNAYYFMTDRNGCTEQDIARFDKLPYKHKVIFVHLREWAEKYESAFYIRGFDLEPCVGTMTAYNPKIGIRRNIDQFDYINFLNNI